MDAAILWPLAGFFAWLWIMCRNRMVDDFGDSFVAATMIIPACVCGPFAWGVVILSEYDGRIT